MQDNKHVQATLLLCSNKSLLGLAKVEMTIKDECDEREITAHDMKALLTSIQIEASRSLHQIIYAQSC